MDGINNKKTGNNRRKWSVDELNDRLYHKDERFDQKTRRKIHSRDYRLKNDWDNEEETTSKKGFSLPASLWKKFFVFAFVFFLAALSVAGISFLLDQKRVSDDLIRMEIVGQSFVDGGDTLTLQVDIQNFNTQPLESAELTIKYPKDSEAGENDFVIITRSLNQIQSEVLLSEDFDVVLFGREGDERQIEAILEYQINKSQAIFQKTARHTTLIRSSPTILTLEAPENIVKNEEVTLEYTVQSNPTTRMTNALFTVDLPRGFSITSVEPEPSFNDNVWLFDVLNSEIQYITVSGIMAAFEGEGQSFHARLGRQNPEDLTNIETVLNSLTHTVWVSKPFIDVQLSVSGAGSDPVVIADGSDIQGNIRYRNTLSEPIENVEFTLHLDGNLYDPLEIGDIGSGFFDSNQHAVVWNPTNTEGLTRLAPGSSGNLRFRLGTKDLVQNNGLISDSEYTLLLDLAATDQNNELREALGVGSSKIIASSSVRLLTKSSHHDGPFSNSGPMPPRVGRDTEYTVTWQITNSANPVKDIKVRTRLPAYVEYLDDVSPFSEYENISYNSTTREVLWNASDIDAGTGTGGSSPQEVSFQVKLTPSLSQLGTSPDITEGTVLTGSDAYTDVNLTNRRGSISTKLPNEIGHSGSDGIVAN